MSDDNQLLIFGEPGPLWAQGLTQSSINFVKAGEQAIQSNTYTGQALRFLIDLVYKIKNGQWIVTHELSIKDAMTKFDSLVASEVILQDPSKLDFPRPRNHPGAWMQGKTEFSIMFVKNATRLLKSGTLRPQTAMALNAQMMLVKKGQVSYSSLYTAEQFIAEYEGGILDF